MNLAIPVFLFSEPQQPKKFVDKPYNDIDQCQTKAIPPSIIYNFLNSIN